MMLSCVMELCFDVKAAISSAIKPAMCRFDLGKLEIDGRGHVITKGCCYKCDWDTISEVCQKNRLPPLLPETVRQLLEKEKTFTNKGDVPSVAGLYQRFFDDVSSSVETLS